MNRNKISIKFKGGRRKKFVKRIVPKRAHRINLEIKAAELRVLDEHGEMIGVMNSSEANAIAQDRNVDLVEISAKAVPPVCKIIDYGKMLYSLKKKEQKSKQANKTKEPKGIRLTFKIDVGDLERQRKLAEKFLEDGHIVRIQMRLRGRERAHYPLAIKKMHEFLVSLSDVSKIDQPAKGSGGQVIATLAPEKKSAKKDEKNSV